MGDVSSIWPDLEQVVKWINEAGGVAVLAHPSRYKMTRTKGRRLMADFCDAGGQAIEVCAGNQVAWSSRKQWQQYVMSLIFMLLWVAISIIPIINGLG